MMIVLEVLMLLVIVAMVGFVLSAVIVGTIDAIRNRKNQS